MIYKTSELNVDTTVKLLLDSELGFLLIQSDSPNSDMYDLLSKKYAFVDRQGMFGNNTCITYHLFDISYHKSHKEADESGRAYTRATAIRKVFERWTAMGYNKRHSKDPYHCKPFIKYLDDLEWTSADYMLLMVV